MSRVSYELIKMNLARDFGPRLFSWMAGYGSEVWTAGNYYFWVVFLLM
jgi:glycerol uptake facilitator-like aquaporin